MNCPVCDQVRMREVQKNDVLIDICPQCKGVWLDRGELDKLMNNIQVMEQEYDRMEEQWTAQRQYGQPAHAQPPFPPNRGQSYNPDQESYKREDYYKGHEYKHGYPYKKKKKSVFGVFEDLFD